MSNPTPTFGDVVSYTKPLLTKGEAAQWTVRHVDPDGTLTLDLIPTGFAGRGTARQGVDPGKVTVVKRGRAGVVAIPNVVEEDDLTVSEASVPVSGPKFEIMSADYHRNGMSGRGFYVGLVKYWGDAGEGEDPRLFQIIATPEYGQEDVSKMTFDDGYGAQIYVTDLMVVAQQGIVAFGRNSFRGDNFSAEARAIIIQTRKQWDNQMLALRR